MPTPDPTPSATDIDALRAYKLTLKGIVVTFVICNVLILIALGAGFWYTIRKIDQTAQNANEKIDRSYAAVADYSKKVGDRLDRIDEKADIAATNVAEVVGGSLSSAKAGASELKELGKQAVLDYLKRKAEKATTADKPAPTDAIK